MGPQTNSHKKSFMEVAANSSNLMTGLVLFLSPVKVRGIKALKIPSCTTASLQQKSNCELPGPHGVPEVPVSQVGPHQVGEPVLELGHVLRARHRQHPLDLPVALLHRQPVVTQEHEPAK